MSASLIAGCGDIGVRVARLEQAEGRSIYGLARSPDRARLLEALGIAAVVGDLDDPAALPAMPEDVDTIYYFAPPPGSGESDPRLVGFLGALARWESPRRLVYISTSGVYGDCAGAWIDETAPRQPKTPRAKRRLAAELALQDWAERTGVATVILRVPGIYGPGRLPVQRLTERLPVVRAEEAPYSNRIHADDLASVALAAARAHHPGSVYNVSDGNPSTMTDYFFQLADALGLPRPPTVSLAEARTVLSASMLSFLEESKRLDNRRMLSELSINLRYPTLAVGIPACLSGSPGHL